MQVNPALLSRALLNQAFINNQLKPKVFNRVPYKPIIKPKVLPLKPEETLSKLEKLIPEFDNVDKFTANSKEFVELFLRGISKETATKFFEVLQKISAFIGSPEYNSVAVWRVFDGAFSKRALFSTEEAEAIGKWKAEVDTKIKPKTNDFGKRPASDDQSDSNKKQRPNGATLESILLKRIDTLEDEVSKLRDELTQTKLKHGKELAQIRLHVGIIPTVEEEDIPEIVAVPNSIEADTTVEAPSVVEPTKSEEEAPAGPTTSININDSTDLNSVE